MLPPVLALLGLSATEFAIIAVLYFVLFGADKVPELARSLGKAQAQLGAWRRELDQSMRDAQRQADFEFELQREQQIRSQQQGHVEAARIRQAAKDLGIATEGRSVDELREAIARRVGGGSDLTDGEA